MWVTDEKIKELTYKKCLFDIADLGFGSCDSYIINYDEQFVYYADTGEKNIRVGMINRLHLNDIKISDLDDEYSNNNIIDITRFTNVDKDFFVGEIAELEFYTKKFIEDIKSSVEYNKSEILAFKDDVVIVLKDTNIVSSKVVMDTVSEIYCIYEKDRVNLLYDKLARYRIDENKEEFVPKEYYFQRYYDKKCIIVFSSFNGCPSKCYIVNEDDKYIYYVKKKKNDVKIGMVAKNCIESISRWLFNKKDKCNIDLENYRHLSKEDFVGKTVDFSLKYKNFFAEIFGKKTWYHKVKVHMWDTNSVILEIKNNDRFKEMPIEEFTFIEEL